jgi:hypothetical protein
MVTGICGVGACVGFVFQFLADRWKRRREREEEEEEDGFTSMILGRIGFAGKSRHAA